TRSQGAAIPYRRLSGDKDLSLVGERTLACASLQESLESGSPLPEPLAPAGSACSVPGRRSGVPSGCGSAAIRGRRGWDSTCVPDDFPEMTVGVAEVAGVDPPGWLLH